MFIYFLSRIGWQLDWKPLEGLRQQTVNNNESKQLLKNWKIWNYRVWHSHARNIYEIKWKTSTWHIQPFWAFQNITQDKTRYVETACFGLFSLTFSKLRIVPCSLGLHFGPRTIPWVTFCQLICRVRGDTVPWLEAMSDKVRVYARCFRQYEMNTVREVQSTRKIFGSHHTLIARFHICNLKAKKHETLANTNIIYKNKPVTSIDLNRLGGFSQRYKHLNIA